MHPGCLSEHGATTKDATVVTFKIWHQLFFTYFLAFAINVSRTTVEN